MKMVKSLLLGSAAGLVAMTGAQAADLPVKAKPVQYVKICSLYGAGFYYIPGTDTCLKIGGWVRLQEQYNVNGNSSNGPLGGGTNLNNRVTNDFTSRNRGYITADARSQTEYGTLRSYIAVGTSNDNQQFNVAGGQTANSAILSVNRAFIQFAGFTAGRAISFFDSANTPAIAYAAGVGASLAGGMTTGDGGWNVLAYTAQLGNGLSATLSVEDARANNINRYAVGAATVGVVGGAPAVVPGVYGATADGIGTKYPDLVANLRVDQTWGSAQLAGAVHNASAAYDTATGAQGAVAPGNATGWAVSGGLKVNLPMLGRGDFLDTMLNYSVGATRYTSAGVNEGQTTGQYSANALNVDGVFAAGGGIQLTTQWSAWAGYEHNWNTAWKTSLWSDYLKTTYNSTASAIIGNGVAGYNASWSGWQVGSRTAWVQIKDLEVGLEVYYTSLTAPQTQNAFTSANQSAWAGQLRVQRNFYP
jgi:hypothetical protein